MTLSERAAYLKGLKDGLGLDVETTEGKLISGMLEMLEAVSVSVRELQENAELVSDELDEIEETLDELEDAVDEISDYLEDDEDWDWDGLDVDEDDDDYPFDDDDVNFAIKCPACEYEMLLTEQQLTEGQIECPGCGEILEFDFDEDDELDEDE